MKNETKPAEQPIELKNVRVVYKGFDYSTQSATQALCGRDLSPEPTKPSAGPAAGRPNHG